MPEGTNLPNAKSRAYAEMQPRWQLCREVRGGTESIRKHAASYLPRFIAEDVRDWQARVNMTVVVDFFEQAVVTFVGLLRSDPDLGENVPAELREDWENLDGEGNHGAVVAQFALDAMLTDGHVVLFADSPPTMGTMTRAEQQAGGVRPYVVLVKVDQILSWRTGLKGGERLLLQFVFQECTEEPDGAFGSRTVTRYRVYRQQFEPVEREGRLTEDLTRGFVLWELWEEQTTSENVTAMVMVNAGRLYGPTRIPARVAYGGNREGLLRSKPPLLGLAYSNIRWGQVMSERASALNRCGMPVPVIVGELVGQVGPDGKPSTDIVLSSSHGVHLKTGGDFRFAEAQGSALEQARQELQDWEKRMGAQSLAMLQRDTASAETATAHRLNRGREDSKLRRALRSLEDALEGTLQDMAAYRGLDPETIDVTVNRDIGDVVPPEVLTLLSSLEEKGQLTLERLLVELHRARLLGNDFDPQEEVLAVRQQMGTEPATNGAGAD